MTVQELKEKLQNIPDDTVVMINDFSLGCMNIEMITYCNIETRIEYNSDSDIHCIRPLYCSQDESADMAVILE